MKRVGRFEEVAKAVAFPASTVPGQFLKVCR